MATTHSNVEDARGWSKYPSSTRNLLNSAGSDVRNGTLGHRKDARAIGKMIGYVLLDYKVNATRTPTRTLFEVSSYLVARGWDKDNIVHILNIHRARPKLDKTITLVSSDTWATKRHDHDKD